MKKEIKKYLKKEIVIFSINVNQEEHKSGKWKKRIDFPAKWSNFTINNTIIDDKQNGLALLTGKINNIIVIDIDNINHWKKLLLENNQEEPDTVKVISGSGGLHYYFKYTDDLNKITSKDHCFGKDYDIDVKTNGGCIIIPPTKYFNKNLNTEVEYKWEKNIFDYEPIELPEWIKNLLEEKKIKKIQKIQKIIKKEEEEEEKEIINKKECKIDTEDANIDFKSDDIELLIDMLSIDRCDCYNDWISIGMCLFNLDKTYLYIWRKWSKQSDKYEDGQCELKWKSFKKSKDGIHIGSLLMWCKIDNKLEYDSFIKRKKLNEMIISKFPNEKLHLGNTIMVNDKCNYTPLQNKECLIKGGCHNDLPNSMYIEMLDKFITIKCKHHECFGKIYPCQHIQLTKQEMNIVFNGDINITINNNKEDDELVEFQQIDIYEIPKINELVFNSLNGESSQLAEIIHYFNADKFNYGEDNNWYIYEDHRWKNLGLKNSKLRYSIQPQLKELYTKLINYYKANDDDKKKITAIKQIAKSFGNTNMKNNIMAELIDIYSENNNVARDFVKNLDSNNYLIGFKNGVYDLKTFCFRDGNPNDFISMTVDYDYQEKHTDKYDDLLKFLHDVQPNKEEYEYMMTYLSIGLIGNILELFTILTGCGRNGKSKLIELLKITFGDYFGSVESQLFTRPRPDANSPDPGLLSLARKKIVIASEPEKNEKLNSGFIKFLTGRDSTTLRNCHQNKMVDFSANFITLLICNNIPDCDDIDNAFSKRLRCINFPTEFITDPTKENQKKIDVNINENFKYWKMDFMLLLIEYYKNYSQTKELKPTENILKWTAQYKEDTDIYLNFLNENTEVSEIHIKTTELYENFKGWFKINNPNTKIPSNREFISSIKKHKIIEHVKINGTSSYGIKNLKLKDF
jgi:P4 family phage/plasmid primase-like protien